MCLALFDYISVFITFGSKQYKMIIDLLKKLSNWLSPKPAQALDDGIWDTDEDFRSEYIITALSHSVTQSENYAIVLTEKGGELRVPVVIGGFEAQAIAVALEGMTPNAPLTHDLMKMIIETTGHTLIEVSIDRLIDGIFGANLVLTNGEKRSKIRCRVSDAVAIAVRFDVPIYVYQKVANAAGILPDE